MARHPLERHAAWPIALAHGLGAGSDAGTGWLHTITGLCVAAVLGVVGWRFSPRFAEVPEPRPAPRLPAPRIGV